MNNMNKSKRSKRSKSILSLITSMTLLAGVFYPAFPAGASRLPDSETQVAARFQDVQDTVVVPVPEDPDPALSFTYAPQSASQAGSSVTKADSRYWKQFNSDAILSYLTRDEKTNTSHIAPADSGQGDIAITIATPFLVSGGRTLAQVEIKTGRTHQIRCQASYHHHPLTGDAKYHGSHNEAGYYLHSSCIIAEGRVITGTPGEEFTAAAAVLLKCPEGTPRSS